MPTNADADRLIAFLDNSPTPFHAVAAAQDLLRAGGVPTRVEHEKLDLQPGGAACVVRGGGSLIAVRVPVDFRADRPAPFHIIAAHTDSPNLRLKPRPAEGSVGLSRWGVEIYGGVLFNSWLDRDLGVAGRIVREGKDGSAQLVRLDDHALRIPQLAIHLDRTVNEQGLVLNPQKHLVPVTGMGAGTHLQSQIEKVAGAPFAELSFDLCLYDLTPAGYGGADDDFIFSGRLDNLAMCHAGLMAFLAAPAQSAIQVVCLFDHEEVGNVSARGAASNFLGSMLERVSLALGVSRDGYLAMLANSFLVSADMAHAAHPNYADKHEPEHFPVMNGGLVLKKNSSQRYTSDATGMARLTGWAKQAGVSTQNFLSRTDLACGSTLGPGLSAALGITAVDVGNAMLSMHSAREMCGSADHTDAIRLFGQVLQG